MSKKDWDQVAAIEKAIAQKYGKEAVQDFRCDWEEDKEKEYFSQLSVRRTKTQNRPPSRETLQIGEITVRKRPKVKTGGRTCPVCKTYSFSAADDLYMNRFQVCRPCYYDFVQSREEQWTTGWRPDDDYIDSTLSRRRT